MTAGRRPLRIWPFLRRAWRLISSIHRRTTNEREKKRAVDDDAPPDAFDASTLPPRE